MACLCSKQTCQVLSSAVTGLSFGTYRAESVMHSGQASSGKGRIQPSCQLEVTTTRQSCMLADGTCKTDI